MGIVLWLVSGAAAWASARIIPLSRRKAWIGELTVSVLAALALGAVATALDFGGWREPDWRAGLFTFFGAVTAIALFRLTISGNPGGPSS
jgi:hypothetical protein